MLIHDALEGCKVLHVRAVQLNDDVTVLESGLIERTTGNDAVDVDALSIKLHAEASCHLLVKAVETEVRADNFTVGDEVL